MTTAPTASSTAGAAVPADVREEARFLEQVAQQHRHWIAFLTAQLQLLDVQAARTRVAFEYAESGEQEERAARSTLAAIPPTLRTLFEAVLERERHDLQAAQGDASDPDQALRAAIQHLLDDARGVAREDGRGLLPRGTVDAIRWYAVDPSLLTNAPTAATYAAASGASRPRQTWLTVGGATAAILVLLVWMLLPHGAPKVATTIPILVDTAPAATWPVTQAVLVTENQAGATRPMTLTLDPATGPSWPKATGQGAPRGFVRTGALPLQICAPPEVLRQATSLTLPATGDLPARQYRLAPSAGSQERPDLVLMPCSGDAALTRVGTLQAVTSPPEQALGTAIALPGGARLTVQAITLIGASEEPGLPTGQTRVRVRLASSAPLDWPTLAPTLLMPSGQALLPSETTRDGSTTELRYLVPEPSEPVTIVWRLTLGPGLPALRWRAILAPPPGRLALLRDALAVDSVTVQAADSPGMLQISVRLTNRGSSPLRLSSNDIQLTAQDRPVAAPDPALLATPLAPHEQRVITVTAPEQPRLLLSVGVRRFVIQPREP